MEPMEVESVDAQWTISADCHDYDDSLMIGMDCKLHCVTNRPFDIIVQFDRVTQIQQMLTFVLKDSRSNSGEIIRCQYHRDHDMMTKSEWRSYPLMIHADISPDYSVFYAANGSVTLVFPNDRLFHKVPIAIKCSNECLDKPVSMLVYSTRDSKIGMSARLIVTRIYKSIIEFRAGVKNIVKARVEDSQFRPIRELRLEFPFEKLATRILKDLLQSLSVAAEDHIPGSLYVLNQALAQLEHAPEYFQSTLDETMNKKRDSDASQY